MPVKATNFPFLLLISFYSQFNMCQSGFRKLWWIRPPSRLFTPPTSPMRSRPLTQDKSLLCYYFICGGFVAASKQQSMTGVEYTIPFHSRPFAIYTVALMWLFELILCALNSNRLISSNWRNFKANTANAKKSEQTVVWHYITTNVDQKYHYEINILIK